MFNDFVHLGWELATRPKQRSQLLWVSLITVFRDGYPRIIEVGEFSWYPCISDFLRGRIADTTIRTQSTIPMISVPEIIIEHFESKRRPALYFRVKQHFRSRFHNSYILPKHPKRFSDIHAVPFAKETQHSHCGDTPVRSAMFFSNQVARHSQNRFECFGGTYEWRQPFQRCCFTRKRGAGRHLGPKCSTFIWDQHLVIDSNI